MDTTTQMTKPGVDSVTWKKRSYHDIMNGRVENGQFVFDVEEIPIESEDTFDGELMLFSFPIQFLNHIDKVLSKFNLNDDPGNFLQQCREVMAVAENHQNAEGGGKMSFQSFFHNVPESLLSVNDNAIVVVALYPEPEKADGSPRNYEVAGYIHINLFDFKFNVDSDETTKGCYYNILRVSDNAVDGEKIFRRKKIFTLMFAAMHSFVYRYKIFFCYASMGKENKSIEDALQRSTDKHGEYCERLPFKIFSKINLVSGSKSHFKKLINITQDEDKLSEMYSMVDNRLNKYMFYHHLTEQSFLDLIRKMTSYSKTSGVYMLPDKEGNIQAATVALNWGEYLKFVIQNPKGIFKILEATSIMEKFLLFLLTVGPAEKVNIVMKGLSHYYRKEHGVQVTFLPSYEGDPYYEIKKSFLVDEYAYWIICNDPDKLQEYKKYSMDEKGNPRLFIDQPII